MTKLFKNSKQVLSFVLAFAVLAVSLFTGVVINSDAACVGETIYWSGSEGSETVDTINDAVNDVKQAGTAADPIIIDNAEELYVLQKLAGAASANNHYKIKDGISAIVLQEKGKAAANVLDLADAQAVRNHFESNPDGLRKWWSADAGVTFQGTFDGNGVTIYGLYGPDTSGGLFSRGSGNPTLKNFTIKNSYRRTYNSGLVLGQMNNSSTGYTATVENVAIINNCMIGWNSTSIAVGNMALIGSFATTTPRFNNLLVYGNIARFEGADAMAGNIAALGIIATYGAELDTPWFTNSVISGVFPYGPTGAYTDASGTEQPATQTIGWVRSRPTNFSGVYTDMPTTNVAWSNNTQTYTADQIAPITLEGIKGSAAVSAMPKLDWDTVWFANAGIPALRAFHNISDEATPTENGHIYKCEDCNLVGVEVAHIFKNNACVACGAALGCGARVVETWGDTKSTLTGEATVHSASEPKWYNDTFELLDPSAENSEANPYIVDSAESLAWLATKATAAQTTGKWYKVADGIKAFNMNTVVDMSGDMTTAEVEAALNTTCQMKTWWSGNFAGNFDGNGVTIYGVQGYNTQHGGSGGLFGKVAAGTTLKNFTLKNSYFKGDAAGSLFNNATGADTITMEGIVLTGNVLVATRSNGAESYGGVLFGRAGGNRVDVKNCLAYNNIAKHQGFYGEKTGYDVTYGFIGNASKPNEVNSRVENTIILDCLPFTAQYSYSSSSQIVYSNVYTNMIDKEVVNTMVEDGPYTTTFTGGVISKDDGKYNILVKLENRGNGGSVTDLSGTVAADSFYPITFDGIKGAAAVELMSELDWADTWFAVEGDIPTLRAFHIGFAAATDNGDGTHSESCNCGLKGVAVPHTFDKAAADGKCTICGGDCAHAEENIAWISNNNATCLTPDTGHYECTACGLQDIEMDNPDFVAGHKFKDVEAIPADCQGAGTIAHKLCEVCGNAFATTAADDEPMENALESTVDPIKDHTAKTDDKGDIIYDMSEAGYHAKTCSVCNTTFDKQAHVGDYTYDAAGHAGECTVCKMATSGKEDHTFVDGACSTCPYVCPHDEADIVWVSNNDGACDKADTGHYECSACKLQDVEMENPDFVATEHKWIDNGEPVELGWSATATACKTVAQKCENCGAAGPDREIGHVAGEWQTPWMDRNFVAPCATDGQHTEILACSVCFFEMETKIVPDAKTGHSFDENEAQASTCTMPGNIAYKYCPVCNYSFAANAAEDEAYDNALEYDEINLPLDPDNHAWADYESTATCTYDGVKAHKFCTDCYLLVVDGETTDVTIDWDAFYAWDYEADEPIGIGAKLDAELNYIENETFAEYVAENYPDLDVEVPAYPEDPYDWDAMDAYWTDHGAVCQAIAEVDANWSEAWYEYWGAILEDLQTEAYHEALLEAAEAADVDMVAPADPEAHYWEEVAAEPATCEEPGCVAHKLCVNCFLAIVGDKEVQVEIDFDAINPENFNSEEEWLEAVKEEVYAAYDEAGILIAAGHKLSEVKGEAATTEKEGTKAHYACSECDKLFADAQGKEEVTAEKLVIAKLVKEDDKTSTDDKTEGDKSDKSPATGESVATVAAVAALMGAAFVLVRKARKA